MSDYIITPSNLGSVGFFDKDAEMIHVGKIIFSTHGAGFMLTDT